MECPLFPFADLGEWQDRVTVGPQLSGNILMSETSPRASEPRLWRAFLKKPFRLDQLLDAVTRVSGVSGKD